ncbi:hypothetical protein DYX53_09220, partial [Campylobacter coli]|nr:hypothetical protein [Campylobacter coli]
LVIKEKIKKEMNLNLFCLSNSKIKGIDKNSESIIKKINYSILRAIIKIYFILYKKNSTNSQ